MSFYLNADPSFGFRKFEKLMLAARLFWRFPRSHGAWPKYEYLKPWIIDQRPTAMIDVGINIGQFLHLAYRLWPEAKIISIEPTADLANKMADLYQDDARVVWMPVRRVTMRAKRRSILLKIVKTARFSSYRIALSLTGRMMGCYGQKPYSFVVWMIS